MIIEESLYHLIPRLQKVAVTEHKILLYLDNADYTVTYQDTVTKSTTQLSIVATFRTNWPDSYGTWWKQWRVPCGRLDNSALFTMLVAEQVNNSITRFARMLGETHGCVR